MNQARLTKIYKVAVIITGGVFLTLAIARLPRETFNWSFLFLIAFTLLVTPLMSIQLPRTTFILSFSDSIIFLAFILYDGNVAIILATLEMFANCFYLKRRGTKFSGLTFAFNIGGAALATTVTYLLWTGFLRLADINFKAAATTELISALGFLAISQFLINSFIIAVVSSTVTGKSFWQTWKSDCFSSSLTQIAGASLAVVAYKLIYYADFLTTIIVFFVGGIVYVNYRQTIRDINESIEQAEQAEREKADIERLKVEEAHRYAAELELLLLKEEQTSELLLKSKNALEHAAFHDFLTDLPNRTYLVERLNLLIEIGIEVSHKYYVLFLDLKRFKNINDSLGHNTGDRVLKLVGKRLVRLLHSNDTVARLGGDEFAIILNDLSSVEEAEKIARQIYEKLTQPFLINGNKIYSDLNIGIAPFDAEHETPEDVLRDADIAMHHAQEKCCGVAVFDKKLRALFLERITLEADLRFAVERGELSMHYQPLVSLKDGELVGFEALLRWHHRKKGFISPVQLIPIAEDSGLIIPITKWILRQTCAQIAQWQKLAPAYQNLLVSVNISGRHLTDESLVKDVRKTLTNFNLAPASLKLEITESVAMENAAQTIKILNRLKDLGVRLSMDDFGTGYSSLSYLHLLPFDSLKIDRSFVIEVGENGENSEVLQTIVSLAKNLKMQTFAEGIETETQLAILQNLGCDYGQGYLMSKPLPAGEMELLLYQKRDWLPFGEKDASDSGNTLNEENLPVF
ncbi:MAG: putative bifunctional diguanylate cyclase/phosphodiesterase [Pyrinomonadaceae bacterium]